MRKFSKIKSAVIGLGFGKNHVETLYSNKYSELISICDKKKNYKKISKKLKCNFYSRPEKIINDNKVKLVTIATYDNFHAKQIELCLKRNKAVFAEKPFCQTTKEFIRLKKIIIKKKIKISSKFVLRSHPKFKIIYKMLKKNFLGKIYYIEGEYNYGRIHKIISGWRGRIPFYSVTQGGGIHLIDLMIWYLKSKPIKAVAAGNKIVTKNSNFKYYDNVSALINFKNGVIAKVTSNFSCMTPHDHTMKIYGSKGTIVLSNNKINYFNSRKKNSKGKIINFKMIKKYKSENLNSFVESIAKNKKFSNLSKNEILNSMATCLAIDKSLKTKRWEKIKN